MKSGQLSNINKFCLGLAFGVSLQSISLFVPAMAQGDIVPVHKIYVSTSPSPLHFAGEEVFSIPTPAGGFTAEERSMIMERNMNNALVAAKDRSPKAVEIEIVNSLPVIRLAGKHILTVDTELAAANNMSCLALADRFADSMRRVLSDTARVDNYVAHLDGDYLMHPYSTPAHREQWQAARLNHAASSYRKDLPSDIITYQSMKNFGFERLMKRDYVGAESFFRSALSNDGNNERARYGLGIALMKQGKMENAMQNLGIASYLEPDDAQVHIAMGELLESQGDEAAAIVQYQTASRLQPENPEPALYVADLREDRDQISKSAAELNEAQANCPDSEYIRLRKKDQVAWRLARPY